MSGLADQIQDGSISTLEAAAAWRLTEAHLLREKGRRCLSLYVFGYVVEMRLTAACFQLLRYRSDDLISLDAIRLLSQDARGLRLMTSEPHDVAGWARYLIHLRRERARWFGPRLRDTITAHADGLYEHWRPRLRYKALTPTSGQLQVVVDAAEWFNSNYPVLWS